MINSFVRIDERLPIQFTVNSQRVFGMLHFPFVDRPCPAVLICHGLGGDKNGRYRVYVTLAQMLALHGIATLRFDYRGCGDSEGDLEQLTLTSQIDDALAAVEWLKAHPRIDSQRLGILGRSFGGLIATHCAEQCRHFCSLVLWSAVFDGSPWSAIWNEALEGKLTSEHYNTLTMVNGHSTSPTLWQELFKVNTASLLANLTQTPLLNIHGEKDKRVDVSHANKYAECRQAAEAISTFLRLPNADHDFVDQWDREEALEATVEWFRQTL